MRGTTLTVWWRRMLTISAFLLTAGTLLSSAQESKIAAEAGQFPDVSLETRDGKTQFFLGDPIELDLVVRNINSSSCSVNVTDYGDIADNVEITPAKGWISWRGPSEHDYLMTAPPDEKEARIPIVLHQGFVFREPGHYEVRVTTHRLIPRSEPDASGNTGISGITTNAVGIDVAAMPPGVESSLVSNLTSEIASADMRTASGRKAHKDAVDRLAALEGDEALHAKIDLMLKEDDDMRQATTVALATTRNLQLQLSLLDAAWKDVQHPPIYDLPGALQQTRALLRGQTLPGWVMAAGTSGSDNATKIAAEEHAADMDVLLRSLPARSGASRAAAAYYLLEDRSLSPAQVEIAKPFAIESFPQMDNIAQHMLLETAWPAIRDPALLAPLRTMLDKSPTDKDAVKRLIELDPVGAKPYVIRAVCDPQSFVPLDSVAALPDATLPEVDGCLSALLRVPPSGPSDVWQRRAMLAARFASPAIVPFVRQGWKNSMQDGPILALLLRYQPTEALSKMQVISPAEWMDTFYYVNKAFKARGASFPRELLDWLRGHLKEGTDEDAGFAAYELSQGGAPEDRAVLEERLALVRSQWSAKLDQLASPMTGAASKADKLEVELMSDLRGSTIWSLTNADAENLARGCMSEQCKFYGQSREETPVK